MKGNCFPFLKIWIVNTCLKGSIKKIFCMEYCENLIQLTRENGSNLIISRCNGSIGAIGETALISLSEQLQSVSHYKLVCSHIILLSVAFTVHSHKGERYLNYNQQKHLEHPKDDKEMTNMHTKCGRTPPNFTFITDVTVPTNDQWLIQILATYNSVPSTFKQVPSTCEVSAFMQPDTSSSPIVG